VVGGRNQRSKETSLGGKIREVSEPETRKGLIVMNHLGCAKRDEKEEKKKE
jgi:hypothetical protein